MSINKQESFINTQESNFNRNNQLMCVEEYLKGCTIRMLDLFMFSLDFDLFGGDNDHKYLECMQAESDDPFLQAQLVACCLRRIQDAQLDHRAASTVKMVKYTQDLTVSELVEFANTLHFIVRRKDGKCFEEDVKTRNKLMIQFAQHLGRMNMWKLAELYMNEK